jgi:hypothetical protein
MREPNFQANNGQRKTPTIEYYNHASGDMIPFASGSMEKGKSLLSSGSTENLNSLLRNGLEFGYTILTKNVTGSLKSVGTPLIDT